MQMLTAHSSFDQQSTKLLVIEQLLHPALKSTMSPPDLISSFDPPHNKSWRRH